MSTFGFVQPLLTFLLVYINTICTEVSAIYIYIVPFPNDPCPDVYCQTLSQFAANSSRYHGNEVNVSVCFLPGNHSLDVELLVANIERFWMITAADSKDNEAVLVKCNNQSGKLDIRETTSASLNGLHFVGCVSNAVSRVQHFTVEDTIFQGAEGRALVLKSVAIADIVNCSFIFSHSGGAVYVAFSNVRIDNTTFDGNTASFGAAVSVVDGSVSIARSQFMNNEATDSAHSGGGVISLNKSNMSIDGSIFVSNKGVKGGVLSSHSSNLIIVNSIYSHNKANHAGVMVSSNSSITITKSNFSNNAAKNSGGVVYSFSDVFVVDCAIFTQNIATAGGTIDATDSSFTIIQSTFNNNSVSFDLVIVIFESLGTAHNTSGNKIAFGGVIHTSKSFFNIADSTFTCSSSTSGGVIHMNESLLNIKNCVFTNNSAAVGGILYAFDQSTLNIANSIFSNNTARFGGAMIIIGGSLHITNSTFSQNLGSLYSFSSNITLNGDITFEKCVEPSNKTEDIVTRQEGGAITSYQSNVYFISRNKLLNNQAEQGGAILATESVIVMYNGTTVTNNTVTRRDGGGIHLHQTSLEIKGNCTISNNSAVRGGGIHAISSSITVYQQGELQLVNNSAVNGGGIYFEVNSRLSLLKSSPSFTEEIESLVTFESNSAKYGGAIYVADDTNSAACVSGLIECFIQTLEVHRVISQQLNIVNMFFHENTATDDGSNLFGGLLDRCIPSPFAEIHLKHREQHNGVTYLESITDINQRSIASLPVRICFCTSNGQPDCDYQLPTIEVEKGKTFTVSLVAVDQVNRPVSSNIISLANSTDGDFGGGQQTQKVNTTCTDLVFNIFSPQDSETIMLYADGPCGRSEDSIQHVDIQFLNCTCPIGFEPSDSTYSCECECHSALSDYITNCDYATSSFLRVNTNSWITYINNTGLYGYITHPNCPFDYCYPPTENVSINLNSPNGADMQCTHNRSGVLCGACKQNFSLSLGSSRCLPCYVHWPAVFVVISLTAIVAGILLVTLLLVLNMTVTTGLINGFVFYANIVAASSSMLFPSSEPTFPTVVVAWLNLDIGIDVCFFDGLDAYGKTWLQLAFPMYIISLVIIVIIACEYSNKFAKFIGKRDPIATLATLVLLSYAKLLSTTIAVLSFTVLHYPDGSQETLWLVDGNVKYLQGKHIALFIVVLLIILVGVPFTILLFVWQWLVKVPKWKLFNWTRNTKLNVFISTYHVPYNCRYRYWTGLLLLVRVVMYITVAVTVSVNPQVPLFLIINLVGGLLFLEGSFGTRVYRESSVDFINKVVYFNLLVFATSTLYDYRNDLTKQTILAYISTALIFILIVGVIIYHVALLCKSIPSEKQIEYPMAAINSAKSEISHTTVEIPKSGSTPTESVL